MSAEAGTLTRFTLQTEPAPEPKPTEKVVVTETATGVAARPADQPADDKGGEKLLAGKFKTAEDLEKGYTELEKKLGEKPADKPVDKPADKPADAPVELTAEQKAYTASISAAAAKIAGSDNDVKVTLEWARANASDAEKAMFDSALASGNVALVEMAFGTIRGKYTAAMGTQGTRVSGDAAPVETGVKGYASRAEMLAVIRSKEYKKGDTRIHAAHAQRLKATNFGVAGGGI